MLARIDGCTDGWELGLSSGFPATRKAYHGQRQEKHERQREHPRHAVPSQELDGDSGYGRSDHRQMRNRGLIVNPKTRLLDRRAGASVSYL